MIEDTTLLRISILCVILGLGTAYIGSLLTQPDTVTPANISRDHLGETVVVTGVIPDITRSDEHLFFRVTDGNTSIQAVWFNAPRSPPTETAVMVKGTIDRYNGERELIVDTVNLK